MKTTIELPDALYRKLKSAAAEEGRSIKDILTEAVTDRLRRQRPGPSAAKAWEAAFGGLRGLHRENRRIDRIIAAEFETIDEKQWR